jgi:hypothetical protein
MCYEILIKNPYGNILKTSNYTIRVKEKITWN